MSLIQCPECLAEISASAIACPHCGRPTHAPPLAEREVVVTPPMSLRENRFPPWAFVPIGLGGIILLIVIFALFRSGEEDSNVNVNVRAARRTTSVPSTETRTVTVPTSSDPQTVYVPEQPASVPGQTTTIPSTTTSAPVPPPDKGTVMINARIAPPTGSPQSARNTKFYLLDKDLEAILSEARVDPIEGNGLAASLGLAAVFPDRYRDFQRAAMRAISEHVKYSGTTDGTGNANLSGVAPKEYYLFGITRVGRGFALWSSQVTVVPGENVMNLSPQNVTVIPGTAGE
ncbi:MAG: zinc ribbon domain-containing protein [Pyrinomonadaceae bacterium]